MMQNQTPNHTQTLCVIKRLGILAGGGALPDQLAAAHESRGGEVFIVAFEGQTNPQTVLGREHIWTSLGAVGAVIKALKSHEIRDVVMIGKIRRPGLFEIKPDLRGASILIKMKMKINRGGALGDNKLLELLRDELQADGLRVHGVQRFMDDLLMPLGAVGQYAPSSKQQKSIKRAVQVAQRIGSLDVGQSVIVQDDIVIGVEAIEGTDELIKRCYGYYRKGGELGILVKTAKPQQSRDLDLPTLGADTLLLAAEHGIGGIAAEAGGALLVDRDNARMIADKNKIFLYGIDMKDYAGA
jgi:DUF1009 family protein